MAVQSLGSAVGGAAQNASLNDSMAALRSAGSNPRAEVLLRAAGGGLPDNIQREQTLRERAPDALNTLPPQGGNARPAPPPPGDGLKGVPAPTVKPATRAAPINYAAQMRAALPDLKRAIEAALAKGSVVSNKDFYHAHMMVDADNKYIGLVGHAHEFDGKDDPKANNINIVVPRGGAATYIQGNGLNGRANAQEFDDFTHRDGHMTGSLYFSVKGQPRPNDFKPAPGSQEQTLTLDNGTRLNVYLFDPDAPRR